MKDNKAPGYGVGLLGVFIGMSLTKMPYLIVLISVSIVMMLVLYCIIKLYIVSKGKAKIKRGWTLYGALISVFLGYAFLFIDRTIEEFNIFLSMKNIFGFCGIFFIALMFIISFIGAAPQIKKMGGFANMVEEQNPGSWFMMKIGFWFVIACVAFLASIFIWERFLK